MSCKDHSACHFRYRWCRRRTGADRPVRGRDARVQHRRVLLGGEPGPQWIWSARDNGTNPRRLARGAAPSVSPNGRWVAYWSLAGTDIRLALVPAAGGPSRVLLHHWGDPATLGWSPDSRTIAAATGTLGARRLVTVDVGSGHSCARSRPDLTSRGFSSRPTAPASSTPVSRMRRAALTSASPGARWRDRAFDARSPQRLGALGPEVDRVLALAQTTPRRRRPQARPLPDQALRSRVAPAHAHAPGPSLAGLRAVAWSASGKRLLAEMPATTSLSLRPSTPSPEPCGGSARPRKASSATPSRVTAARSLPPTGDRCPRTATSCRSHTPTRWKLLPRTRPPRRRSGLERRQSTALKRDGPVRHPARLRGPIPGQRAAACRRGRHRDRSRSSGCTRSGSTVLTAHRSPGSRRRQRTGKWRFDAALRTPMRQPCPGAI